MARTKIGTVVLHSNKAPLTEAEREALEAVVGYGRGRARAFMDGVDDIIAHATWAEAKLASLGLAATYRSGASLDCRSAGPSAATYKWGAAGSFVHLERKSDGWRLVTYNKITVRPKQRQDRTLAVSEAQMRRMSAKTFGGIFVIETKSEAILPGSVPAVAANDDVALQENAFRAFM